MKYFIERKTCPACQSNDVTTIFEKKYTSPEIENYLKNFYTPQGGVDLSYLEDASFVLNECSECKLVFQKFIGNDLLMEQLYEHWIDPKKIFENEVLISDLNYYIRYAEEIANIIAHFNKIPSELSFFDFGMGWGKWSLMAKAFGCTSFGTELSESRIEYATKNGIKVISYNEIKDYQFDFINTEQVFEHIPQPLNTLSYLSASLKPNGILKISVPNGRSIKRALSKMNWQARKWTKDSLNPVAPLEHINCFQQYSIEQMCAKAGLKKAMLKFDLNFSLDQRRKRDFKTAIKDTLRPYYHRYLSVTNQSTYLFFQKQ